MIGAMATRDLGVRPKPPYIFLGTFLGCLALIFWAWWVGGWTFAVIILCFFSIPLVISVGCVAVIARSAWLHRYQVFTHMKANVDPHER